MGSDDRARSREAEDRARSREAEDRARSREAEDRARSREAEDRARSTEASDRARSTEADDRARSTEASDRARSTEADDRARSTEASDRARSTEADDRARSREARPREESTQAHHRGESPDPRDPAQGRTKGVRGTVDRLSRRLAQGISLREHAEARSGPWSLSRKIFLLTVVPFLLAIVGYLLATRPMRRDLLLAEAKREVRDDALILQEAISQGLVDATPVELQRLAETIAGGDRVVLVLLFSASGELLASSNADPVEPSLVQLAARALSSGSEAQLLRDIHDKAHLDHAFLLSSKRPTPVAAAVVRRNLGYVDDIVGGWNQRLTLVAAIFALVMFVAAQFVVKRLVTNPLGQIIEGVEQVAEGKLPVVVKAAPKDELGRLASAFNVMTQSLSAARAHVEEEQAERALLEARMRRLQTLAAAGEIAASLAHEIGSPLNVILGRARMMANRPDTSEATKRDLNIVAAQTERITRVVQKLLSVSRPPKAQLENVSLALVAEETLAFVGPECRKRRIETSLEVHPNAPRFLLADRDQLTQIVFNLCHNAMQAQPSGGAIRMRLLPGALDSTQLCLEVSDRGPGVPAELKGRVFDPFMTTKGGDGTGLGLAIVDGMAREMGGTVHVGDAEGGGALFRVTLPALASG